MVLDHPPACDHLKLFSVSWALTQAVRDGNQTLLHLLLRHPALRDVGIESQYPLVMQEACEKGYTSVVQSLLEYGVKPAMALPCNSTPLIVAARCGHEAIVRALLLHGTLVDDCDSTKLTALCAACRAGKEYVVRTLLEHGAKVDLACGDTTPLVSAANSGNETIVGLLLSNGLLGYLRQGVSVDGEKSRQYFHALSTASRNGYDQVVDTLLIYDTAVEIQEADEYREVLQAVSIGCFGNILTSLLDRCNGVRTHDRGIYRGPLRQATQLGYHDIVRIFRERGVTLPED